MEDRNKTFAELGVEVLSAELRSVLEHIPSGLAVYRQEGEMFRPIFCNTAFYQVMGYLKPNIAQSYQNDFFGKIHPEDKPHLCKKIETLMREGGELTCTFRMFHDKSRTYRWLHMKETQHKLMDGTVLYYAVYTDVNEEKQLETELVTVNEKMQDIINAIPGGVAIYRVTDIFETVYFSNGVPELTGYTVEEYREMIKSDAGSMTYPQDTAMVIENLRWAIREHRVADFEFRKQHRDGHIVWVRIQAKQVGESDGAPLLHCVFHNISDLKEIQMEMNHLINASSGGVASCRVENGHFIPTFYSDGVVALSGYTREEFAQRIQNSVRDIIHERDREWVTQAAKEAVRTGEVLNISFRIYGRGGSLSWIHLNGCRIGPLTEGSRFYASFTGISAESRMYQEIANEAADAIYVIDRENYDVLYFHESKKLFPNTDNCIGKQCYKVLQGMKEPCPFCNFPKGGAGEDTEVMSQWNGRVYRLHFRETNWNGIPAFIQYLRDVTEEVETRQEKKRLEQYFQTLVESLPGGVAVVRCREDEIYVPEFMSAGFADMTGSTLEQAWERYSQNALSGVHPEDIPMIHKQLREAVIHTGNRFELTYRLQKGMDEYIWVRNTVSIMPSEEGELRQYCYLQDITKERKEQERIREQYQKLILQHYREPGPNALVVGHCNITQNLVLEVNDFTELGCIKSQGTEREAFFMAFSSLIIETQEQQKFLNMYLNEPMLETYRRKQTEQVMSCMIQLPGEKIGRYVQCKVNLVPEPDTGDITGILTVTDITDQMVADQVLRRLSYTGYDHIIVLDLLQGRYTVFTSNPKSCCVPPKSGIHEKWMAYLLKKRILPKDRETYRKNLEPAYITQRLEREGAYTFEFSLIDDEGDIRVKRMTVFDIDLRLGKVGLSRTDVTEMVLEQQGLLNMLAYTFEFAGLIDVDTGGLTLHTRQTVLEDLPPYTLEDYDNTIETATEPYGSNEQEQEELREKFRLTTFLAQLEQHPVGYDFVCAYRAETGLQYKKINILWGDRNQRTICLVQADMTEMLAAERKNKQELEEALRQAKQANQAKSAFLSAMSHDIRTPMNAIMGMTALAISHPNDAEHVTECLKKISVSSKHLLHLINDVLDMSKIEHAKIELNREYILLQNLVEQASTMVKPQILEKNQQFHVRVRDISHGSFYGDALRMNQILINILSNAVKFTPVGGSVDFQVEEIPSVEDGARYRFSIRDTGIGMSEEVLSHVFEPFARGAHVNRVEGTGLGLSITKGLVERMGGTISVESRPDEGSMFQVELEFEAATDEQTSDMSEKAQITDTIEDTELLNGRRFLIAEDNEINSEILESLLELYGATSVVKPDGEQVVQEFSDSQPGSYDAILMDIQMPVMNGYEATKAIRVLDRKDARTIPVIAMTANAFAEDVQAALDAGMNAHVAKPIEVEILKNTLGKTLS